jgi:hypothetical protein
VTGGGLCEATLFLVRITRPQAFTAVFFALLVYLLGGWVRCGPIGLFVGPVLVSLFMTAEYHTADVPFDTPVAASPPVAP